MTRHPGLFERLPAIYRTRDAEESQAGQFEAYIGLMDEVMEALDDHIEQFYHDHFIEHCDDWVVPYIGDLLGVSHLKGDPWTIRASTARAVALARRKGTLGAMEQLAFSLTGWAAHAVEMRERMLWNQHLNHQRPDAGGVPPQSLPRHIADPVRHGTVTLHDPGVLSFLGGAFDPFARTAGVKPTGGIHPRPNLPNVALFLWRQRDYQVPVSRPVHRGTAAVLAPDPSELKPGETAAAFAARFDIDPQGRQVRLHNTFRYNPGAEPPDFSEPDRTPGPMPAARLEEGPPTGNAAEYIAIDIHTGSRPDDPGIGAPGLVLHLNGNVFAGTEWTTRGEALCAWEEGLRRPLLEREVVVDPIHGRLVFGLPVDAPEGPSLRNRLRVSHTYAAPGPVGAHPVARTFPETIWPGLPEPEIIPVSAHPNGTSLRAALTGLSEDGPPRIIEITDSMTHRVHFNQVTDAVDEGGLTLSLARPFWIRAATGQRPEVILRQPLRMRAADPGDPVLTRSLDIRIEGVLLSLMSAPTNPAIVERAAVNALTLDGVTLDPAGHIELDGSAGGSRADIQNGFALANDLDFADAALLESFEELPLIRLDRCVTGPIMAGQDYRLELSDTIVDGRAGPSEDDPGLAIGADAQPEVTYGPQTVFDRVTVLGRVRVRSAEGAGGLFAHTVEVRDHQSGCVRFSRFTQSGNRLPPNFACVFGAGIGFTSTIWGMPGYGQLDRIRTDSRVLEDGPEADEMGAYGFLLNTHRLKNLSIRLREFTPVGIRPILATVT
ncbi:MAG: hypothetical protein AAGD47_01865 [Pseudomonadota bacterium]